MERGPRGLLQSCGRCSKNRTGPGDPQGAREGSPHTPRLGGRSGGGPAEPLELWPEEKVAAENRGWAGRAPEPRTPSSLLLVPCVYKTHPRPRVRGPGVRQPRARAPELGKAGGSGGTRGGGQSRDSGVCGNRALCFARSRLPAGDGKPRLRPRGVMARGKSPEGPHPPGFRKAPCWGLRAGPSPRWGWECVRSFTAALGKSPRISSCSALGSPGAPGSLVWGGG